MLHHIAPFAICVTASNVLRRKPLQILAVTNYLLTFDSFHFHNSILLLLLNNRCLTSSSQAETEDLPGNFVAYPVSVQAQCDK